MGNVMVRKLAQFDPVIRQLRAELNRPADTPERVTQDVRARVPVPAFCERMWARYQRLAGEPPEGATDRDIARAVLSVMYAERGQQWPP